MAGRFVGFNDPVSAQEMMFFLIEEPDERRWRPARMLARMEDAGERELTERLIDKLLDKMPDDPEQSLKLRYRLLLAKKALSTGWPEGSWVIEKGIGYRSDEAADRKVDAARTEDNHEVIDFHVHPKQLDADILRDMYNAGLTRMVILATDTDPADMDREDIQRSFCEMHASSVDSFMVPTAVILAETRDSLYSLQHVTNQDVADWAEDYPDTFIGFGSVDLCKSPEYVDSTLNHIKDLGLKGIKLLPYSQFFDPENNENMHILFEHCIKNNWPILTHTGCASGVFEDPAFSQWSRPSKWKALAHRYPDVPIVMAHLGAYSRYYPGIWLEEAAEMIGSCENVYSDTAAVCGLLNNEEAVKLIRKKAGGFDRILFGTDYPMPRLITTNGETLIVNEIRESSLLTDTEKTNVLGENAAKLLGIR